MMRYAASIGPPPRSCAPVLNSLVSRTVNSDPKWQPRVIVDRDNFCKTLAPEFRKSILAEAER
jgi:hypothetical protein